MKKRLLAFIPARGGSKRLKNKNILLFDGKPLIYYTIANAIESKLFDKVVVSTDSDAIAQIAIKYGSEVIKRPGSISTDFTSTAEVIYHTLKTFKSDGCTFEAIVTMQPTNPLRPAGLIKKCIKAYFNEPNIDSVVTVSRNKHKLGYIENDRFYPDNYNLGQRSQDLKEQYFENGLLYVSNPDLVLERMELFGEKVFPIIVDHWSGYIDIDDKDDFKIAENLYIMNKGEFGLR